MHSELEQKLINRIFQTRKDIYQVLSKFMKVIQNQQFLNNELAILYLKEVLILLYQFDIKKKKQFQTIQCKNIMKTPY